MSKALPWNISGVGFDAREAARDAARREGLSIGEWLHDVIADKAVGAETREIGRDRVAKDQTAHDRIEAVTARLEAMGAVASKRPRGRIIERDMAGRNRASQNEWTTSDTDIDAGFRNETQRLRVVEDDDRPRSRRAVPPVEDASDRVDEAVAALERRTQRSERRTDDALASVARLLESTEARREREQAGVARLAHKLSDIESRLAEDDANPIKGALARLEARLEQIGQHNDARSNAAPVDRLEQKLNVVLDALSARPAAPQASPIALAAAQGRAQQVELPLRRRRLGDAIAEIAERQRTLETPVATPRAAGLFGASREPAARREDRVDLEGLREDISTMAEQLRGLAPRGSVAALEGQLARLETQLGASEAAGSIGELKADVRALEGQLHDIHALVARGTAPTDVRALEGLVRELTHRIEAVQAPGAGQTAVDALQRQIGTLAARLDTSESGLASMATIERTLQDLFAHLDETRSYAETAASRAAQEAVRFAIADKGFDRPAPRADVAVLKAMQEDADLRTRSTLDAVHSALEKVVDRLARVEGDLTEIRPNLRPDVRSDVRSDVRANARSDVRHGGADPAADIDAAFRDMRDDAKGQAAPLSLGSAEPLLEPRAGARPTVRRSMPATDTKPADTGAGQADYIAAARRAALAAQTDPSVVALRQAVGDAPNGVRAGLASKSRDFIASHKRPVLLSLAALLVVALTTALVQLIPLQGNGPVLADASVPAKIVAAAEPSRARPVRSADAGDVLSPSTLPRSTPALAAKIPGSDPIVTGSIPSLPAFARPAMPVAAVPKLPAGVVAAANSGDAAAQYTLAAAYAEGRMMPRDFARAAKFYAKAADQGIVPAQYRLGALYEKGLGVTQDKARARNLYRQAADAGNPRAMHNLAVLLADGDGKPDYEGAATWFRRAAQYGVHDSQFNLAILLVRGLGVEPSLVQSYQWFSIAAAQGDTDAATKRDEVGAKLSPSELSVAKALAAAFHPRTADPAATDVTPPVGGWDGAQAPVHLNSARSKISSL